jgi:tRNA A-37 threonylcarbamoyl transferase component Bud32
LVWRVAGRAPSIAALVVGLGIGAGLWIVGAAPAATGPSREDVARVADELDLKLREVSAGVASRATTLSEYPRVSKVVATDAATVLDMVNEELTFRPGEGETIEIGQITADDRPVTLLRMPSESKAAPPLDKPGPSFTVGDKTLLVSNVINVKPSEQTGVKAGRVAVSWAVELGPFLDKLAAIDVPARIELNGKTAAATTAAFPAGLEPTALPLKAAAGARLLAAVRVEEGKLSPLQLGGIGAAVLGLILAVALWRRGAGSIATAPPEQPPARAPSKVTPSPPQEETPVGAQFVHAPRGVTGEVSQFGRYNIVRRLGSGGMAEVFLARITGEAGFEKKVALKIIHKHLAMHAQVVDHFLDEARLASQISHPNIVQISDLGKAGDDYFIAMEYVDGYDLDTLMEMSQSRGALVPARVALSILRKICDGLHAAHTAVDAEGKPMEMVHRDVKAENVLVSRGGEIKVTDFGIAKANQRAAKTQIGMVKGTAAYMAPEQRIGQPVDKRADVYGVGAIGYELLTGQEINLDLATLAHLGREGWPHLPPISQHRPDLPAEIDNMIFKALAYEREDRWPSCQAFEEALEQYAMRHNLVGSDKVVAQWVEQEITHLEAEAKSGGAA